MRMHRIKNLLLNTAERAGILWLAQFILQESGNHLIVLAYHRVAETNYPLLNRLYDLVDAIRKDLNLMLKEKGIQMAFTISNRISRLKQDDLQLFPRLVPYSVSLPQFHLRRTALQAANN